MTQTEAPTETDPFVRVVDGLDANFGVAPRRRAAHAKGLVVFGSFTATPEAATISRASHFAGQPVEVVARFSNFPGGASHPDAAPESNPRGLAVQFRLADGSTTDLLAHSINGFPGRTVEDFADFLFAIAPDGPGPEAYLADHPAAAAFVGEVQSHGSPASYATLRYYPVNAFIFENADGTTCAGRYTFEPTEGVHLLDESEVGSAGPDYLAAELAGRLETDAVVFSLVLTIAEPGDPTDDANAQWPVDRRRVDLGRLRLQRLADDSETAQQGLFFDPVRLVDGITLSDDPLLVGRTRTYPLSLGASSPSAMNARPDLDSAPGRWVIVVAVLGSSMAFLDSTAVNVALPEIGRDLGATTGQLQWILSGYLLALASLVLLGGSVGDRYGRRRIFRLGVGVFTAASLLCAVAPTVELLIAARVLQGVGASLLTPGSLAMLESTFPPDQHARAIGAWSGLTGVASALGPILGGYLVGAVSWRAIFVINLPIGVFVVVAAHRHVPETRDPTPAGHLDVAGAALAAIGLAGVTYGLITGPASGLTLPTVFAGVIGIAALVAFVLTERRRPNPMLPLGLFASRQFSAANLVTFVIYGAIGGFFFLFVAFLQIALGYSPLAAGAASLPVTALMLALSARSGDLAQRIGPRIPLTAGPAIVAAGLLLLTRIEPGASYATGILPGVVVFGLGLSLVVAPITATVLGAADAGHAGVASGVNNAVARVAGLLAVAVLPTIAGLSGERFYNPVLMVTGFHIAMATCAALAIAGGVLAWFSIDHGVTSEPSTSLYSCALNGPPTPTGIEHPGPRHDHGPLEDDWGSPPIRA